MPQRLNTAKGFLQSPQCRHATPSFAGWAPHLDLQPLPESQRALLQDVLAAPWIAADQEGRAITLAAATLVPEHEEEDEGEEDGDDDDDTADDGYSE
jgi:hypothetical protein